MKSELTDKERQYLQRMMAQPGYKVLHKIIDGFVGTLQDRAMELSQVDPLRNQETIISAWAYFSVAEQFRSNLASAIQFEVDSLIPEKQETMSPEQLLQRRRAIVLGELDVSEEV